MAFQMYPREQGTLADFVDLINQEEIFIVTSIWYMDSKIKWLFKMLSHELIMLKLFYLVWKNLLNNSRC